MRGMGVAVGGMALLLALVSPAQAGGRAFRIAMSGLRPEVQAQVRSRLEAESWPLLEPGAPAPEGVDVELAELALRPRFRGWELTVRWQREVDGRVTAPVTRTLLFREEAALAGAALLAETVPAHGQVLGIVGTELRFEFDAFGELAIEPGAVLRLLRRRVGQRRGAALRLTLVEVTQVEGRRGRGQLRSGGGLGPAERFEDFLEPLALSAEAPVRLELLDLTDGRALVGWQVYSGDGEDYLGVSDGQGRVVLSFPEAGLRWLQLRTNETIVARIPVAPAPIWRDEPLTLRLRRRADLSRYQSEISRVLDELEDLVLLHGVLLEDFTAAVGQRRLGEAKRLLEGYREDLKRVEALSSRLREVKLEAEAAGHDLRGAPEQALSLVASQAAKLDVSRLEAQVEAMRDRVGARQKAEALMLEADDRLKNADLPGALALLQQAAIVDPSFDLVPRRIAELDRRWAAKDEAHEAARREASQVRTYEVTIVDGKLDELKALIETLKAKDDDLTLRGLSRQLRRLLEESNERAREALKRANAPAAKSWTELSLALSPLLDEISAYLKSREAAGG